MGEDKKQDVGPEAHKKMQSAIPDDTEGHRKKVASLTDEPDGGPEGHKKMQSAIPDTDGDTEGHRH